MANMDLNLVVGGRSILKIEGNTDTGNLNIRQRKGYADWCAKFLRELADQIEEKDDAGTSREA